ncbi:MAG: RNA-binding transcriptional accessory protein [Spirochaetaceae bacterium]|jgi:uncharacterized protein|nr:RNA-binding transcriptional accessory protein [Spirochaetaceae bacterium]
MELNEEFITGLKVDELLITKRIAETLDIKQEQVKAVVLLLSEGSTVPFIARYRKEATGSLDEVKVRDIEHLLASNNNLEERRLEIIRGIFEQGKLSVPLYENIIKALTLAELEDIYTPYKRKKKTRGMVAVEKGLEPLADAMCELDEAAIRAKAADFIHENTENPELSVTSTEDALQGAMDIIAERVAQDTGNRSQIKSLYENDGRIVVKGLGGEADKKTSVYQMYWDYTEKLSEIKAHRILAINRGEHEGKLEVRIDVDETTAVLKLTKNYSIHNDFHREAISDGLTRLLSPAVMREIRADKACYADTHGIDVFSQNLRNLLMQQPIKGTRVLGVDPGLRTGTKCVCLDETGKYLHNFVIYHHRLEEAKHSLLDAIKSYNLTLAAIGNGTGSKETQEILASVIADNNLDMMWTIVDEDGASVYSASDVARDEFPALDLTIRGAISIGRRLQDPLAELVKVPPQSIGVGLYQHDVNQKRLTETLDEVVSSVVNNVGVNINTASASLLGYVSGINSSLAKKIVKYRDEKGKIVSRIELNEVPGMGPKTFEQCAGFLKIPESEEKLDNSWVHPENYEIARVIAGNITETGNLSQSVRNELKSKYSVGETTINDILEELLKPGRDPRDGYPKPVMQKGVLSFDDLREGMSVTGKIKNVVDFGAFVDIGIKEIALIHVSEMSDSYVKNPMELVKVGDVLEFKIALLEHDRRRVSLTRKSGARRQPEKTAVGIKSGANKSGEKPAVMRRVVVVKKSAPSLSNDDGTMYNPFAGVFSNKSPK